MMTNAFETMTPAERRAYEDRNLREIVLYAFAHAPYQRRRLQAAGIDPESIRTAADLDLLPVLSKDDLINVQQADPPFGGLLGMPMTQVKRIFMSPGPIYDPEGRELDYWRFAPALKAAGFTADDIVHNIFPYHFTPAGAMFDGAAQALGCTLVPTGVGRTEDQLRIMTASGATAYTGLPSYLLSLLKAASAAGYDVAQEIHLRKAMMTAEPLPPSLRDELQSYGIDVYQCYGTADIGCVAYECEVKHGLHLGDGLYVSICDPATGQPLPPGEVGEVVVTPYTKLYPLLRFGTGDLSQLLDEPCSCGRSTPRLSGILGRVGEGIKVRGLFVHPHQVKTVFARFPQVQRWRLVVTRHEHRDELTAEVEGTGDIAGLEAALREGIKVRTAVKIVPPGSLPADAPAIEDRRRWE